MTTPLKRSLATPGETPVKTPARSLAMPETSGSQREEGIPGTIVLLRACDV